MSTRTEKPSARLPRGVVRVTETGDGRFTNLIGARDHELLADELGACTSITMRMYADRKGWPLERVSVDLRHEKIHAEDCAHCETEKGSIDRIHVEITVDGPLDDEQRERLLDIAHKCPVHRTLAGEIDMPTGLKE